MSPWLGITIGGVVGLLGIGERFYNRFVPDVEAQKRQLQSLAFWSLFLGGLCIDFFFLIKVVLLPRPVTRGTVLEIAVMVAGILFQLFLIIVYWIGPKIIRLVSLIKFGAATQEDHIEFTRKLVDIVTSQNNIFMALESETNLSDDFRSRLKAIMHGDNSTAPDQLN